MTTAALTHCMHCQLPVSVPGSDFCCRGCEAVYQLIHARGLERFYVLGGGKEAPVANQRSTSYDQWLPPLEQRLQPSGGTLELDVQGLHCAACVWLLRKLFSALPGSTMLSVNSATGRLKLTGTGEFPLRRFVADVESFGYRLGPPGETPATDRHLLVRMGICIALAANSMMFSLALYLGLSEGLLARWVTVLAYATSAATVFVGGSLFLVSAWQGLKRRVIHFDQPVALGIVLAFAASSWGFFSGHADAMYSDSISVFVTLMVVGKFIRHRVLRANQARLLRDAGIEGLRSRRQKNGTIELVPSTTLQRGDEIIVAAGEVVPVAARAQQPAQFSLDWINGESRPRTFATGDLVPAGAAVADGKSTTLIADQPFAASDLKDLLRSPVNTTEGPTAVESRVIPIYVFAVLLFALFGGAAWLAAAGVARALEVMTAVLVVSCPCAVGVAIPLAHELAYQGLRRRGLFVRSASLLARLPAVRQIVFDKTGTLTDPATTTAAITPRAELGQQDREALGVLAAHSAHPACRALSRSQPSAGAGPHRVEEVPGQGVRVDFHGEIYALGASETGTTFTRNGEALADIDFDHPLRPDARLEVAQLRKHGYQVAILSGDNEDRVLEAANALGIDRSRALARMKPEAKAQWLTQSDGAHTLFIGDGINDGPAAAAALCSGTPSVDRPFLAARTDFYFLTPGLAPVRQLLRAANQLRRVTRRNFLFALVYNASALLLALSGLMSPWLAAILMPASSLAVVVGTTASLSPRSSTWKS